MIFQEIDSIMAVTIGILAVIFIGALITLIVICHRQKKRIAWTRIEKYLKII